MENKENKNRDYEIPEELISKTEFYDVKTPVTKILPSIEKYDAVVIKKNNKYFGVIDSRALYKHIQDSFKIAKKEYLDKFTVKVPKITDSTSIDDVAYYFYKARVKALPYIKDEKIKGILRRETLLKILLSLNKFKDLKVSDAMTSPVIGIDANASIIQARKIMKTNRINRLVVIENNKVIGVLTNYDIIKNFLKPEEKLPELKTNLFNLSNFKVSDFMKSNIITIDKNKSLADAVRRLVEDNVTSIVVVDKGKPVGILTELDSILSMLSKTNVIRNNIIISGLDEETYQYEDEIRETLKTFVNKVEKLKNENVDFIALHVKKFKTKSYELYIRIGLSREGIISLHNTNYLFEKTFSELIDLLWKEIKKKKEFNIKKSRELSNQHEEE
ncbi:MAG: CBS domain-containing protein [Candidatus Micrarchaeia archaeon]